MIERRIVELLFDKIGNTAVGIVNSGRVAEPQLFIVKVEGEGAEQKAVSISTAAEGQVNEFQESRAKKALLALVIRHLCSDGKTICIHVTEAWIKAVEEGQKHPADLASEGNHDGEGLMIACHFDDKTAFSCTTIVGRKIDKLVPLDFTGCYVGRMSLNPDLGIKKEGVPS